MPVRKWGPQVAVNTTIAGQQYQPVVAALRDGGYVIAWNDRDSWIRFQRYDAEGRQLGVQRLAPVSSEPLAQPATTALENGEFVIAYERAAASGDVLGSRYSSQGTFIESLPIAIGTGDDRDPSLAQSRFGPAFVTAYQSNGDIYFHRFDAGGDPIGSEVRVDTDTVAEVDSSPDVAHNARFASQLVIWTSGQAIYGTIVDQDGAPRYQNLLLVNESTGEGRVTALANGNYVVTIETMFGSTGLQARLFDSNGTPLGPKFDVTVPELGTQRYADVVALGDGGFAVLYLDLGSATIRGQIFDAWGARLGREFIVSASSARVDLQAAEEVSAAVLSDGRLIVTWVGFDSNGSAGIQSQIVDPREGMVNGTNLSERLYGHDLENDEITALAGHDELFGMRGDDALYGGAGSDVLVGGGGADQLFGDAGSDRASYRGTQGVTVALNGTLAATGDAQGDSFRGIEGLEGSSGADRLRGDAAANTLLGGAGGDILESGGGNDSLFGGGGRDALASGSGSDRFYYNTALDPELNVDLMNDFAPADDTVYLLRRIYDSAGAPGVLAAGAFQLGTAASQADDRIVYDRSTGRLYYDEDGSGGAAQILFAQVRPGTQLTNLDFVLYG